MVLHFNLISILLCDCGIGMCFSHSVSAEFTSASITCFSLLRFSLNFAVSCTSLNIPAQ